MKTFFVKRLHLKEGAERFVIAAYLDPSSLSSSFGLHTLLKISDVQIPILLGHFAKEHVARK